MYIYRFRGILSVLFESGLRDVYFYHGIYKYYFIANPNKSRDNIAKSSSCMHSKAWFTQ